MVPLPLASKALGQAIKARMVGLGLEQDDIAEALGVSVGTVSRSIGGTTPIKQERYAALAAKLEVDESWFGAAAAVMQAIMAGRLPDAPARGQEEAGGDEDQLAVIRRQLDEVLEAVRPTTRAGAPAADDDAYVDAMTPKPARRPRRAGSRRKSANG